MSYKISSLIFDELIQDLTFLGDSELPGNYLDVHYDEFETKPGIFPDLGTIRYDCMLSSTQDKTSSLYLIPRRRDVSLTLSECADGVPRFVEPTVTLNMSGTTPPTQVTPGILESSLWTPLNNAVLDEVEIDDSDEEIDVVTPPDEQSIQTIMPGNFKIIIAHTVGI